MRNSLQAELAQHQAEVNQAHADAVLLEMQQEVVLQQEHMQPVMVQDNMELSEDSLSDSSVEQTANEVTCNDYISQLEDDKENQGGTSQLANHAFNMSEDQVVPNSPVLSVDVIGPKLDAYMWKVIQKRDRPGNPFTSAFRLWDEGSSSQEQNNSGCTTYFKNWSLMQSYFHWDNPLPVTKRPKYDNLELTLAPPNSRLVEIREMEEYDPMNSMKIFPHQWFNGGSSSGNAQEKENEE